MMVINTTTMPFNLEEDVLSKLEEKSQHDGISLDKLVNEILIRYAELDMSNPEFGLVSIDKLAVMKIFEKMSREEVVELAMRVGKNATMKSVLLLKSKIILDSFLSWLEAHMRNSSLEIRHNIEGKNHMFIINHHLGENWSLYQKTIIESIFSEILRKRVDTFIVSKMTLAFKFEDI
jgi:hypothetical protein